MTTKNRKRNGRPQKPSGEKLEKSITVKFRKIEHLGLKRRAKIANITLAEYIRSASIDAEIKPRLTEEENNSVRSLIGISTNLNQITRHINTSGMEIYKDELLKIISEVKKIIYKYKQ